MDIYKIVSNSKKTVTDTLNSNKAVEVYPNNFVPTRYKPTTDKPTNTIVKSNNSISNFDKEIERIKKVQAIEDIRYLNDKDKRFNNLNTYINSDKVNQILCSGDLHINKDAVSQPVDEKLITKVEESIYSNEDISYNNENDKKEIEVLFKEENNSTNLRESLGTVIGGETLRNPIKSMRGKQGNIGVIPQEVACILRDREFKNFNEFRIAFWKAYAMSSYANEFSSSNITRMKNGLAPKVMKDQQYGKLSSYILHHKNPIHNGGGVYDLDNIIIVTPRLHQEILNKEFHFKN